MRVLYVLHVPVVSARIPYAYHMHSMCTPCTHGERTHTMRVLCAHHEHVLRTRTPYGYHMLSICTPRPRDDHTQKHAYQVHSMCTSRAGGEHTHSVHVPCAHQVHMVSPRIPCVYHMRRTCTPRMRGDHTHIICRLHAQHVCTTYTW